MQILSMINDIYNNQNIDDTIIEAIEKNFDSESYSLLEAIDLIPELNNYLPLIESVNEINDVKKNLESIKNEDAEEKKVKLFDKLTESLQKMFKWWYKIDPNKKMKTLHLILKITISVICFIFIYIYIPKSIITKEIAARIPTAIGYNGTKTIPKVLFGKMSIASSIAVTIVLNIKKFINSINTKIKIKVNEKDLDKNIKEYDESIDKINDLLDKIGDPQQKMTLEKIKKDLEYSLAESIKLKETINKKDNK